MKNFTIINILFVIHTYLVQRDLIEVTIDKKMVTS